MFTTIPTAYHSLYLPFPNPLWEEGLQQEEKLVERGGWWEAGDRTSPIVILMPTEPDLNLLAFTYAFSTLKGRRTGQVGHV